MNTLRLAVDSGVACIGRGFGILCRFQTLNTERFGWWLCGGLVRRMLAVNGILIRSLSMPEYVLYLIKTR